VRQFAPVTKQPSATLRCAEELGWSPRKVQQDGLEAFRIAGTILRCHRAAGDDEWCALAMEEFDAATGRDGRTLPGLHTAEFYGSVALSNYLTARATYLREPTKANSRDVLNRSAALQMRMQQIDAVIRDTHAL
jgi:hypothetical protein